MHGEPDVAEENHRHEKRRDGEAGQDELGAAQSGHDPTVGKAVRNVLLDRFGLPSD